LSAKKNATSLAAFTDGKDRQTILLGVAGLDEIETLGGVGRVAELKRIFDIAIFMGVDAAFLEKLSRLCDTSVDTNDSEIIDGNW
jgi:hypothetical protein